MANGPTTSATKKKEDMHMTAMSFRFGVKCKSAMLDKE